MPGQELGTPIRFVIRAVPAFGKAEARVVASRCVRAGVVGQVCFLMDEDMPNDSFKK